jgi:hypothetical protein
MFPSTTLRPTGHERNSARQLRREGGNVFAAEQIYLC